MMSTSIQASRQHRSHRLVSPLLHTTLYDLMAAVSAEAGPDEENAATATMVHILNTYRVTCLGDFAGYRLVCKEGEPSYSAVA
jgi:hypothetical protein